MRCAIKTDPRLLREDHFLCFVMDAVLAVHGAAKRWLEQRRTRELLAALDEHRLRDIGLSRADVSSDSAISRAVMARRDQVEGLSAMVAKVPGWRTGRAASRRALGDQLSTSRETGRQARQAHQRRVVVGLRPLRTSSSSELQREASSP